MQMGLCSWTLGLTDVHELMARCAEFGMDGLQFSGDHRSDDPHVLKQAAEQHGLTLFAIDPINSKPDDDSQKGVDGAMGYYIRVIDFAWEAGCKVVTVHGLAFWLADPDDSDTAYTQLVEACQRLAAHAEKRGIRLLWEMCNRYEVPMVRRAAEGVQLVRDVGASNLGLILDSFHMNIEERDMLEPISACAGLLDIYHISDSDRGGIGSGHIDFRAQFDALKATGFDGPVMGEFVLRELAPTTPPSTPDEWKRMAEALRHTRAQWEAWERA